MAAVAGASPVTMTARTPSVCSSVINAAESGRGGSLRAMIPASFSAVGWTDRDGQNAEALGLEVVRRLGRIRVRLRQAGDCGKGALDGAHGGAARIGGSRLRHFRRRIEWNELDQFRQIGGRFFCGSGPDGAIHRILPAVRTRQGSDSQDMRFVEASHGMNRGYRQCVLRQRAGFIGAQHVDAGRFIHGGEPGWKNAQLGQSLCAERGRKGKGSRQRYWESRRELP